MQIFPVGFLRPVLLTAAFGLAVLGGVLSMPVSAPAQDIDLHAIFRCTATDEKGRANCVEATQLILDNCAVCHTYGPIVLQQFEEGGWRSLLERHYDYAPHLNKAEYEAMRVYLTANFNPKLEPPELPDALLSTWTDY